MPSKTNPLMCDTVAQADPPSTVVNQIYSIVNDIFQQTTGITDLQATDTNSLVAMGTAIENLGKKEIWLNSLQRRIGYTIDGYRTYRNDFSHMLRDQFEWGAIVQKLYAGMPEAMEDVAYKVGELDGQSVDQYIISNPHVEEKFFDKVTPYAFMVTIQSFLLKEAFLSAAGMNRLINYIFGQVQNKMEHVLENLGRYTLVNLGVNMNAQQTIHLLSMFNSDTGKSLNAAGALNNAEFLGFAAATIYKFSDLMERMSVLFNQVNHERFTPKGQQDLYVLGDFDYKMGTVAKAYAFNKEYLNSPIKAKSVPYWNALKDGADILSWDVLSTMTGTKVDGTTKTLKNVVAVLCDHDALGTFRRIEEVATTPMNARGLYYNTFWHDRQMWFNDLGENAIIFTLD